MKHLIRITFVVFFLMLPLAALSQQQGEPVQLPNGWKLTPAGRHLQLGDLPLNISVAPNKRWLAVTNNGYGDQTVDIIDTRSMQKVCSQPIRCSWYGLCFSPDSKRLYTSAGNDNMIKVYGVSSKGQLSLRDSIVMGKPWPTRISPAGIALHPKRHQLFVVTRWDNSLYIYDTDTKQLLHKESLDGEGYQVLVSHDGQKAYISCWGKEELMVWNIDAGRWEKRIPVGSHPNEICFDRKEHRLFVANANDNTVSVVNLQTDAVEETLDAGLYANSLSGSTTNGLCVFHHGKRLAVANADNNCLAIFDISKPGQTRPLGFIPVGWYPTNVKSLNNKLWVTDGKGLRSMANPNGPSPMGNKQKVTYQQGDPNAAHNKVQYIAGLFLGSLSVIDEPSEEQLEHYTAQVFNNSPYRLNQKKEAEGEQGNPIPSKVGEESPIKYVFYVIKENRTYDQVLGDLPQGNGDPSLTLFGKNITPNLHKLTQDFVLLDNFYVNAEVSCDGHNWTMGGYATDWLEKTWPSNYSGRGDVYSGEGGHHMGNNKTGFLWDQCRKRGLSYRTYGEFVNETKQGLRGSLPVLQGHVCPNFKPWDLNFRDTIRFKQWRADFDSLLAINQVPRFNTVRFGNDHTQGLRLNRPTPYAQVADNDLAVGLFVDYLSHSPIWKETAIFIIEDDAQNGPDHVDAHRSTAYVAGGFVKRSFVDHTPYTTTSMLRTMELILGLEPMTQYDAAATPMWRCFQKEADLTPFNHLPALVNLNEVTRKQSRAQAMSEKFNFKVEDDVPDMEFNRVLWYGLKGETAQYPAIRRSAFLTYTAGDDDDDD